VRDVLAGCYECLVRRYGELNRRGLYFLVFTHSGPNGDVILFEASVNHRPLVLYEIDDEVFQDTAFDQTRVGKLIRRIFAFIEPDDVDQVINRVMTVHPDGGAAGEPFEYQMRGVGCIGDKTILNPDFADASAHTVGSVQELMSGALLLDEITDWPIGTTKIALTAGALMVVHGRIVAPTPSSRIALDAHAHYLLPGGRPGALS